MALIVFVVGCSNAKSESNPPSGSASAPPKVATAAVKPAGPVECKGPAACKAACDGNDQLACVAYGKLLLDGKEVKKDARSAHQLFVTACDKQVAEACIEAGFDLDEGAGTLKDQAGAGKLWAKACELESPRGCFALGISHAGRKDLKAALAAYEKACGLGWMPACTNGGLLMVDDKAGKKDLATAIEHFQRACDAKSGNGCNALGNRYLYGEGVAKDPKKAAELYQTGCDFGSPPACYSLGVAYEGGVGVAADKAQAKAMFQKSCDDGYKDACEELKPKSTNGAFCSGQGSWGRVCNGSCISVYENNNHCGSCFNACTGSTYCYGGMCIE